MTRPGRQRARAGLGRAARCEGPVRAAHPAPPPARRRSEHFQSIQKISDGTTVPSLVPHLRARLYHLDGVDLWAEQLRARRPAAGSPPQQNSPTTSGRDSLWSSLVQASFARAVAACWSLPLLQLFVKVQLTLLGRHLFLESQDSEGQLQPRDARGGTARTHSRDSSTQSFSRLLPSRLTLRCQQKFLSYAEFLAQRGLEAVVEEALTVSQVRWLGHGGGGGGWVGRCGAAVTVDGQSAVAWVMTVACNDPPPKRVDKFQVPMHCHPPQSVLGDVDLRRPCTEATLRGMLARMQAEFEASAACKGWGRLLLPKARGGWGVWNVWGAWGVRLHITGLGVGCRRGHACCCSHHCAPPSL